MGRAVCSFNNGVSKSWLRLTLTTARGLPKSSDTSGKVWSVYLSEADRQDKALAENWKGDTEGILIFVSTAQFTLLWA
jgi:hypothetical protein